MNNILYDDDYLNIVKSILDNKEFNEIKNIEHHGTSRYNHSLRVSFYSYKISKILGLDYEEVARGGLLHDFFLSSKKRSKKERFLSVFSHPKKAVTKSNENFNLSEKEEDIIKSHMFPINIMIPKYAESWIVNIVDKIIGTFEFIIKFKYKLTYITNIFLVFILNFFK